MKILLGQFQLKTDIVIVSDPCYRLGTWRQGFLENVKKGLWEAYIEKRNEGKWENVCSELIAVCDGYKIDDDFNWKQCNFEVGVDSGQAGIFDYEVYKNKDTLIKKERISAFEDSWYSSCCDITLSKAGAGVIPGGAVTFSGYGNGNYTASIVKDEDNLIVAIKIVFIDENGEDKKPCEGGF